MVKSQLARFAVYLASQWPIPIIDEVQVSRAYHQSYIPPPLFWRKLAFLLLRCTILIHLEDLDAVKFQMEGSDYNIFSSQRIPCSVCGFILPFSRKRL